MLAKRMRFIAPVAATALSLFLGACTSGTASKSAGRTSDSKTPANLSTLTIGAPAGPQGLDPYNCGNGPEGNILRSGYDTLLRNSPDGSFQPGLALSWKYDSPTEFTMKLRSGVKFSDGTTLDASVVKSNLDRAAKTITQITASFATSVKSVAAPDASTVVVTLKVPNPDLSTVFSSCAGMIVSPKLLATPSAMANSMAGSGPYAYDAAHSIPNSTYTFHRVAQYWNATAYPFPTVVFKVISDFNAEYNALVSGQIDVAPGTPQELAQAKAGGFSSVQASINFYAVNLLDREGATVPALKDVRVRQALNYAIDRAAIVKTFFSSYGRATDQMLGVHASGYSPALDDTYAYDPAKAKALLTEAGYGKGFTLPVLSTQAFQLDQILQAVAADWAAIGVKVQDNVKQIGDWAQTYTTQKYPAVVDPIQGAPSFTALAQVFGPLSPHNPFHTSDATLSGALAQASDATSSGATTAVANAQKMLLNQAWYAGVGYDVVIWLYNPKKINGIQMQQGEPVPHFYDWKPGA